MVKLGSSCSPAPSELEKWWISKLESERQRVREGEGEGEGEREKERMAGLPSPLL